MPNSRSRIPMTSCSRSIGTRSRSGPSTTMPPASKARPAAVPRAAGRHPRSVAAASTIVKASTTSTLEARKAALIAGAAADQLDIGFLSSAVLVMRVEDALRVGIEQDRASLQPFGGLLSEGTAVEIELADLREPVLKLFQIHVILLELGVCEVLGGCLLGDLALEVVALVDQFAIGIVAIGFEAGNDLLLLRLIECCGLEDHRLAAHLGDVVFEHLQASHMIFGLWQQANAVLQIDPTHALEATPKRNPLRRRFRGHFVGEQQPRSCNHNHLDNVTIVSIQE